MMSLLQMATLSGFACEVLSLGHQNPDLTVCAGDAAKKPLRILVRVNALELVLKIGDVPGNEECRIVGFNGQVLETTEAASSKGAARAKGSRPTAL
jgi:hypothetical protein